MKNLKKLLLAATLATGAGGTFAEIGKWTKVDRMYTHTNGSVFIYFGANSMPGCYGNNGGYLKNTNADGFNRVYSTLLAASMSDTTVQPFYEIVGNDQGQWSRCKVTAIYVKSN